MLETMALPYNFTWAIVDFSYPEFLLPNLIRIETLQLPTPFFLSHWPIALRFSLTMAIVLFPSMTFFFINTWCRFLTVVDHVFFAITTIAFLSPL